MASNFSFKPMGLSTNITVTASASTFSFSVVQSGGTTLTLAGGNYNPASVRIANDGTVPVFITFGNSTVTTGLSGGLKMLAPSVEVFNVNGNPFMAVISGSTATLNITPGEGQ